MINRTIGRILPVACLAAALVVGVAATGNAGPYGGNSGANAGMSGGFNCGNTATTYPEGYGRDCGPKPYDKNTAYARKQQRAATPAAPAGQTPTQTQN